MATADLTPAEKAARTAVLEPAGQPPMTEQQRTGKVVIKGELPKGYVHKKEPDEGPTVKKAKGGSASARADGPIVKRGKTRGRMY